MSDFRTIPFETTRKYIVEYLNVAKQKNCVHLFFEADVTDTLTKIKALQRRIRSGVSLDAYLGHLLARLLKEDDRFNTYRRRDNELVVFEDVDVLLAYERRMPAGNIQARFHVYRAADKMSFQEMNAECRRVMRLTELPDMSALDRLGRLPRFIRGPLFRRSMRDPIEFRKVWGTVAVSRIGNSTANRVGYGLPMSTFTTFLTIGSMYKKPMMIDGALVERDYLCLTGTVDHDIIDGAQGGRLTRRLTELLESGDGLENGE